ncbi:MAG: hybrid sensor histidine kinase/response regulator [Leptolyngbyaceae cyanobacterium]
MSNPAILCIDDEGVILLSLRDQLDRILDGKYTIELAETGEEALTLFEELIADQIDVPLVICDQFMPGMNGDQVLAQIHTQSPETLTILLTGQADFKGVVNAINMANLYRFLAKPWSEADLGLTVREALRRHNQDRQIAAHNQELQQLNGSLAETVAEQTAELTAKNQDLSKAKDKAEAANRAKAIFLASMSHELRTPLTAILGFSELLQTTGQVGEEEQEYISIVHRSGQHLLKMINSILEASKLEAGALRLNEAPFDLKGLLADLRKIVEVKRVEKSIELVIAFGETVPQYIITDEIKLRRVLLNLLDNAIKFTDSGQVWLRVSRQDPVEARTSLGLHQISDSTTVEGISDNLAFEHGQPCTLYFEVEDTGHGIPPENITGLFQPFDKVETCNHIHEGIGLGLTISQRLVNLLGGQMTVQSEVGKGSTFSFDVQSYC